MIKKNILSLCSDTAIVTSQPVNLDDGDYTVYVSDFSQDASKAFYRDFNRMSKSGLQLVVVLIDSRGGCVDSLGFMIDLIEASSIPVCTVCTGSAFSAASILLSCGTKGLRFMAPSARLLIHNVSGGGGDAEKVQEVENTAKELRRLESNLLQKMAKNCGKKKSFFIDELKKRGNVDWFIAAQEAKKLGIIDHIKVPQFSITPMLSIQ